MPCNSEKFCSYVAKAATECTAHLDSQLIIDPGCQLISQSLESPDYGVYSNVLQTSLQSLIEQVHWLCTDVICCQSCVEFISAFAYKQLDQ